MTSMVKHNIMRSYLVYTEMQKLLVVSMKTKRQWQHEPPKHVGRQHKASHFDNGNVDADGLDVCVFDICIRDHVHAIDLLGRGLIGCVLIAPGAQILFLAFAPFWITLIVMFVPIFIISITSVTMIVSVLRSFHSYDHDTYWCRDDPATRPVDRVKPPP